MKRAALLLLASFGLVACGGSPEDSDTVITDSGGDEAAETGDDTGVAETAVDAPEDTSDETSADAGKLTCTGSEAEPNDTRVSAAKLKDIDDCDGSGGTIKGIAAGGADVDWFTYKGSDTTLCRVDAVASTKSGVRLCIVAFCQSGATKFESCRKGLKTSIAGVDGCCGGPGEPLAEVDLDYSCTLVGANDAADVWMRVDNPGGTACKSYSVDYHF
jgi:hypothetical protein